MSPGIAKLNEAISFALKPRFFMELTMSSRLVLLTDTCKSRLIRDCKITRACVMEGERRQEKEREEKSTPIFPDASERPSGGIGKGFPKPTKTILI